MFEKELDSSMNDYIIVEEDKNYIKKSNWDMAVGLQEVDNLKPSSYLERLKDKNINGNLTIGEALNELRSYYEEKNKKNEINYNEMECDFVSTRIVELLNMDNFELSVDYYLFIHKYLFQDIYEFAVELDGYLRPYAASWNHIVLPVAYLKSDIKIIDGIGTNQQPFILSK